ncbi:MAG: TrkA family potassium uptake protein [Byssovorax sp.]
MRVLIAGAGHAGLSVAIHLRESGHEVTILDHSEAAARRALEQHGLASLHGDATSARLLQEAEVSRAEVVVAMLRRDADNLAVAILARAAGARRVMVRMRDPGYRGAYQAAGVERILSETDVFIGALATAIEHEAIRGSMALGTGTSIAVEVMLPESAAIAGETVSAIAARPGFPPSCVFAAIAAPGGAIEDPRGTTVIQGGTVLLLVVRRSELGQALDFLLRARPG